MRSLWRCSLVIFFGARVLGADLPAPGRCTEAYLQTFFKPLFADLLKRMGGTTQAMERERLLKQLEDPTKAEEVFRRLEWASRMLTPAQGKALSDWMGMKNDPVKVIDSGRQNLISALLRIGRLSETGFLDTDLSFGGIIHRDGPYQLALSDIGIVHVNIFWRKGIHSVADLCRFSENELLTMKGVGEGLVGVIKEKLAEKGLSLAKHYREPIKSQDIDAMNRAELWDAFPPHLLPLSQSARDYLSEHRGIFYNLRELHRLRHELIDTVRTIPLVQNEIVAYLDGLATRQPIP